MVTSNFNQERLLQSCDWFNSLDKNTQISIIEWLTNKTEDLSLSPENSDKLDLLIDSITKLIAHKNGDKKDIKATLSESGLDKIVITALIDFCEPYARPYQDAKILLRLKKANLKKSVAFVFNHAILFKDFYDTSEFDFTAITGLKDFRSAFRVFAFLRHHYEAVARRQISIDGLSNILSQNFNFQSETVKTIVAPIEENYLNMSISTLFRDIDLIKESLAELSDRLDADK